MESSSQQETVNTNTNLNTNVNANNEGDKENEKEVQLTDIEITNENMALNVLVSFVSLAQKRGSFSLAESSKIWECVKAFKKKD
jgi:hypothetical protein